MKPNNILKVSQRHVHYIGTTADGDPRPEWASALGSDRADVAVTRITSGRLRGRRALITWGMNLPESAASDSTQRFARTEAGRTLERVIAVSV